MIERVRVIERVRAIHRVREIERVIGIKQVRDREIARGRERIRILDGIQSEKYYWHPQRQNHVAIHIFFLLNIVIANFSSLPFCTNLIIFYIFASLLCCIFFSIVIAIPIITLKNDRDKFSFHLYSF